MTPNLDTEAINEAYNRLPEVRHWMTSLIPKRKFDMEACIKEDCAKVKFAVDLASVSKISHPIVIGEAYNCIAVLLRVIDVLEGRRALGKPEEVKQ